MSHEKMMGLQEIFQKTIAFECVQSIQFVAKGDSNGTQQFSGAVLVDKLAAFVDALESTNFGGEFDLTIVK